MDTVFSSLDDDIQEINNTLQFKKDINADRMSKDLFKLIDLITDFFINFQITEPQNIKLFGLFLPIHAQCFSIFSSQGIFSQYEISHFWTLFIKEFMKATDCLVKHDFSKFSSQINENILPFLQNKDIDEAGNEYITKFIPNFISLLNELSTGNASLSIIALALNESEKLKMNYYDILVSLNLNGENVEIPQNHTNLFHEIEYTITFYHQLMGVREMIKHLSDSITVFSIKPIHNVDEIRIFSEKCIQLLILEIKSLINYTTDCQIHNFFRVCTLLNELIASSHLFMNQHIIEIWNKILPSLNMLSIALDESCELQQFSIILESQSTNTSYNFTVDKIRSLIDQGIPNDFRNSYYLFCYLIELRKKCNNSTIIPYIEKLISSTTTRIIYSKLIYDQQNLSTIFLLLDKEPSDIDVISYLKSCILKLVNIGFFPSPKNSLQLRIIIAICDSIVKSKEIEWIKYIPTSEMMMSLISFDNKIKAQMKNFLSVSESSTVFVDHFFIDEIEDSLITNIFKFAERQIQLSNQIRPHLFNFSVIYEIFPLINEIHKKYGQVNKKIRIDVENIIKSESTYIQLQKVINNGLFNKEEEEFIAKRAISFLVFLLYEPEEGDTYLDSFFDNMSSYFFVPHCTELLADCYKAFECFDSWRLSNPEELDDVFNSLLTVFNKILNGSSLQFDQMKNIEASFREKIGRIEPKWENEFNVNFTNIEKYTVIGPMLCTIAKILSTNNEHFPLSPNDVIRIVAQVNNARLIQNCLQKVINIDGAVFNVDVLNDLIQKIERNTISNVMADFVNHDVGEIINLFRNLDIVNPKFILNYFNYVYHFLCQQIEVSSFLCSSNVPKALKEVLSLLINYSSSSDHFKLREAINILNCLISSKSPFCLDHSIPSHDLNTFKSTINLFLEKADAILCLVQMKLYMRSANSEKDINHSPEINEKDEINMPNESESLLDPVLHQLSKMIDECPNDQPQSKGKQMNSTVIRMKSKVDSIKANKFDERFNILKNTDPNDYIKSEIEQLEEIHDNLSNKLFSFQTYNYDNEFQHIKSDQNLKKLEEELSQIELNNQEKRKDLENLSNEYENLLRERDEQFQCIQSEASEEHNRMSIMQLIINNDLDLSMFEQHVVDPQIVFLHEQLKDATTANTRLVRELRNRKLRIESPPLPQDAMIDILRETSQHRNWLSNDATNVMSLRSSLKHLQKQREDLFKELIGARISYTQQKISTLTSTSTLNVPNNLNIADNSNDIDNTNDVRDSNIPNSEDLNNNENSNNNTTDSSNINSTNQYFDTIDPKKQSDTVNEYMAELDKIAQTAEFRKDYAIIQEEFAFTADKLFFTLEEEIKELKNEIKLRKKYGDNLEAVQMKNLQNLLKVGMMPNNIH